MFRFDVEWQSIVTLLAIVGCLAGSGAVAWKLFCAAVTRNAVLAQEAALLAAAVLFAAFVFFHQQESRPLPYEAGRTVFEQAPGAAAGPYSQGAQELPATREALQHDAVQRNAERQSRLAREDQEQREHERIERERLLESLTRSLP